MQSVYQTMDRINAAMQQADDLATILNVAATAEAMAVTFSGAAIAGAANYTLPDGSKGLPAMWVSVLKALQATEQKHYEFLTGAGAKPLTLTFTLPDPKIGTDYVTLFKTVEALDEAFVAAYMAAARSFAVMKMPDLVKVAMQIGGVEAEHRALARLALNEPLPHNRAYEKALFTEVSQAADVLTKGGFIGGTGQKLNYMDFASKVEFGNLSELTPGGQPVAPLMPAGMPRTGEGGTRGGYRTLSPIE